ncbi:ABC transporter ATP-binding protein [Labedaea rhizosphaerae]|uniref:ABC-2 type transport system ATP-binding protein n=1 Tax=Labedaea rhizosphaerae TaxID=598644 RepID=A0A4R6RVM5_LABRH|nr:ABC transporter ATP-binding protein [Labedaea rhizosphaerae]TDP90477.1 ABC-2 type transport system ATP-binding protein [Labedaea rhizosphaerae]
MTAITAIDVRGLTKRFGPVTAVHDVGFQVEAGAVVAVLGQNGAGKTTTIEILEGFQRADGGHVRVLGTDPAQADRRWRSRIGLVLQSTSLDPQVTVLEAVELHAALYPNPRPVDEMLAVVGLTDDADTRIGVLSGGRQRRVDLALGMVGRPDLLFLDEPTTGLDPQARRSLWAAIRELNRSGTTILLTTHYLDEAQQLADRVIVMSEGRVIADATPDQLRARAGGAAVRFPLPPSVSVPPALARHVQDGVLVMRGDVGEALAAIVGWARAQGVDLQGLEVGAPSLEEAYLALTEPDHEQADHG